NPSFARGWQWSGWLRLWAGQPDVGIDHFETSMRLNPLGGRADPYLGIGMGYLLSRRFEDSAASLLLSLQEGPSTPFPKFRTYRSGGEIDFVAPSMDDRVAIEVIDELDDALLQLVCGADPDVAEHGAGCFGEKPLDEVEPGTVFGGEHKREAAVR